MPEPAAPRPPRRRPLSTRRRVLFGSLYAGYLAGLAWLGERLFWRLFYGVPITRRPGLDEVWELFYPEIRESGAMTPPPPSGGRPAMDVLLLGGSVLQQAAGAIESALRERYGPGVRVVSLAKSAHTSRDSYWKSLRLKARPFDLTILYDGINDARMNCCPRPLYRDDYTHCTWYREFQRRLDAGRVTLPELVSDGQGKGLALNRPSETELDYGLDIKTGPAFRRNLAAILDRPRKPGGKFVVMTFATHLPPGYTRAKFESGGCDYGPGPFRLAAELWGRPEGIARAMTIHNEEVVALAKGRDDVILVDQDGLLPKDGTTFSDPCHLTASGCETFASNVVRSFDGGSLRR